MTISPIKCFFSDLANKISIAPTPISNGASNSGVNIAKESPIWLIDTNHAVIVVPMFAPIMTPTACVSVKIPAFTNPTTITVVAPELWIIAVINAPRPMAIKRLFVSIPRNCCIFPPAVFCIPSDIICIPYKNIPRPPTNPNRFAMFLTSISFLFPLPFLIRFLPV